MTPRHSYLALPFVLLAACGPAKTLQAVDEGATRSVVGAA